MKEAKSNLSEVVHHDASPGSGTEAPDDPAEATLSTLPAEILLLIMETLEQPRRKRTLLHLLSTCRRLLVLGMPLLMRELHIELLPGERNHKLFGLLEDKLGLGKLKHVAKLSVVTRSDGGFHIPLIREVAPSLEELSITFDTFVQLSGAVSAMCRTSSLRKLTIRFGIAPNSAQQDPGAAPFEPLARHLGTLATFESLGLDLIDAPRNPLSQRRSWASLLLDYPAVAERLHSLAIDDSELEEWEAAQFGSVRTVRVDFDQQPFLDDVQWVLDVFRGCTALGINMADTSELLDYPLDGIREPTLYGCSLNLTPEQFPAAESLVSASGISVRLEPDWRTHEREIMALFNGGDGADDAAGRAYAAVEALRAEEAFWLGLNGVSVDRYGDWEVFLSDVAQREEEALRQENSDAESEQSAGSYDWMTDGHRWKYRW
ncbi:hypothetical protein DFJ74DRAFT_705321 [Hyaloraphidium curvatum]|nr:hypothetical protein DFJ74DRAFT_705321 [Hyaloraphidium curvatum]